METRMIITRFFSNRSMFFALIMAFWIFLSLANAKTELSGSFSAMAMSADANPIIVKEDLIIPKNGRMIINKGCKLFFKPFTGIIVEGSLSIEGTTDEPVLFTSINDSLSPEKTDQKANPFDWNGILITKQAQDIALRNCIVKYSVYGLKSQNANMIIDNGIFKGNGQFNCTINDKILPVYDNLAYSYVGEKIANEPEKGKKDLKEKATWLLPSAIGATVAGAAALCFMAYFLHQKSDYVSLYNSAITQSARNDYYEKQKPPSRNALISGITGGVLLSAGGVLFVLDHNQKKEKNISFFPIIGPEKGISVSVNF